MGSQREGGKCKGVFSPLWALCLGRERAGVGRRTVTFVPNHVKGEYTVGPPHLQHGGRVWVIKGRICKGRERGVKRGRRGKQMKGNRGMRQKSEEKYG